MVLEFYNQRRRQVNTVFPNAGHEALVDLEKGYEVHIVTQNIDDLHERAGSKNIVHLHGEILKSRSTLDPNLVYPCTDDINLGDKCEKGAQLRPHIVWFGEGVPMLETAAMLCSQADMMLIVGTSMQVYPAAGLVSYAPAGIPIYYIDPKPSINHELKSISRLKVISEKGTTGIRKVVDELLSTI